MTDRLRKMFPVEKGDECVHTTTRKKHKSIRPLVFPMAGHWGWIVDFSNGDLFAWFSIAVFVTIVELALIQTAYDTSARKKIPK